MGHYAKILLLSFLILVPGKLFGQEIKVVQDFRLDASLGLTKEFFDALEVGFESKLKLEKDATVIDEIDFDLELTYSPYNFLRLGIGYRMAENRRNNGQFEINHRLSAEVELRAKYKRFRLENRIRYQNVDDDFFIYSDAYPPDHILRCKLELRYNIRNCKLSPFTCYEIYGKLNSSDKFAFKHRYAFGGLYSFGQHGKLKAFYRIIQELNHSNPYLYFNVGLGYMYDF